MTFRFSLLALAALGCSPGELHLTTEDTDTQPPTQEGSETVQAGGSSGSASSGISRSEEEGDSNSDSFDENAPCYVNDECISDCSSSNSDCVRCESDSACPNAFPHCSQLSEQCVECTSSTHCLERFGPLFAVCDRGRCVQCQRDSDCGSSELECDRGWCGSCDHNSDCDPGSRCSFGRCIPD